MKKGEHSRYDQEKRYQNKKIFSEIFTATFFNQTKSELFGRSGSVSNEVISVEHVPLNKSFKK